MTTAVTTYRNVLAAKGCKDLNPLAKKILRIAAACAALGGEVDLHFSRCVSSGEQRLSGTLKWAATSKPKKQTQMKFTFTEG